MINKFRTVGIIAFAAALMSPAHAMFFCCGGDDEAADERTVLVAGKDQSASESVVVEVSFPRSSTTVSAPETSFESSDAPEEQKNYQIISFGKFKLQVPKSLVLTQGSDGFARLKLDDVFTMKVYPDYDQAKSDPDVTKFNNTKYVCSGKESLKRRMDTFYVKVYNNLGNSDRDSVRKVIASLDVLADKYEALPVLVRFARQKAMNRTVILFEREGGALLVTGPEEINSGK